MWPWVKGSPDLLNALPFFWRPLCSQCWPLATYRLRLNLLGHRLFITLFFFFCFSSHSLWSVHITSDYADHSLASTFNHRHGADILLKTPSPAVHRPCSHGSVSDRRATHGPSAVAWWSLYISDLGPLAPVLAAISYCPKTCQMDPCL